MVDISGREQNVSRPHFGLVFPRSAERPKKSVPILSARRDLKFPIPEFCLPWTLPSVWTLTLTFTSLFSIPNVRLFFQLAEYIFLTNLWINVKIQHWTLCDIRDWTPRLPTSSIIEFWTISYVGNIVASVANARKVENTVVLWVWSIYSASVICLSMICKWHDLDPKTCPGGPSSGIQWTAWILYLRTLCRHHYCSENEEGTSGFELDALRFYDSQLVMGFICGPSYALV